MLSWLHGLRRLLRPSPRRVTRRRPRLECLEDRTVPVAPTIPGLAVTATTEGGTANLVGLIVDPDVGESHTLLVDWGDESPDDIYTLDPNVLNFDLEHVYAQSGTFTINVTAVDPAEMSGSNSIDVTVANALPSVSGVSATAVNEGGNTSLTGFILEQGADPVTLTVTWGDSSLDEVFTFDPGATMFDLEHTYQDNPDSGTFTILITPSDPEGDGPTVTTTVAVSNVAPSLSGVSATAVNEGGNTSLTGFILDQGALDNFTLTVNWGDGSAPEMFDFDAGTTMFDLEHTYADDPATGDTFPITLTIADDDGGMGMASTTVAVANVAPMLSGVSATAVNEGGSTALTGFLLDQGILDTFTLTVNWGDGSAAETFTFDAGTTMFDLEHTYADNPASGTTFTINLTATDDDGGQGTGSALVTVTNAAPALSGVSATSVDEGGSSSLTGFILDQGLADSFTLTVNWGDGTPADTFTFDAGTTMFDLEHTYADNPATGSTFSISLTLTDDDGGAAPALSPLPTATVRNVAPTLSGLSATATPQGGTSTLTGFVLDQGSLDTQTVVINWGDGTATTTVNVAAGTTTFTATHVYNSLPGNGSTFTISVTATDKDGAASPAATTPATVTAPLSASQRFLTQAYLDLLGRPVDAGALAGFGPALDSGALTRVQVALILQGSPEGQAFLVNDLYRTYLRRDADPLGRDASVQFLGTGGSVLQLASFLLLSEEYFQSQGQGTNQGFLNALYRDVLNRAPDAAAQTSVLPFLNTGGIQARIGVVAAVLTSTEAYTVAANDLYLEFLHRPADPTGLAAFSAFLQQGGRLEFAIAVLVASEEYLSRPASAPST